MYKLIFWALLTGNVAIGAAQVGASGGWTASHVGIPLGYTGAYGLFLLFLRWREREAPADSVLLASICALTGIGLAALVRLNPELALRQLYWVVFGLILFATMAHIPIWHIVHKYTFIWIAVGLALLMWPSIYGMEVRGARSWALLGPLSFQPAEFARIFFVFGLSSYLSENKTYLTSFSRRHIGPVVFIILAFAAILTYQKDLGTALLLSGLVVAMVALATASLRYLIGGGIVVVSAGLVAVTLFDHVRTRFVLWLDPWPYLDGRGYQIAESLFALGSGGVFGTGWGLGMADRIPIVESDFIYSLIVEEIGLVGAAGVLFLLAVVSLRMMSLALDTSRDDVVRLSVVGFGLLLTLQSFLIVGGVTRLLPVTGVTLPFISYGGSSLLGSFMLAGMAYNLRVAPSAKGWKKGLEPAEGVVEWSKG